MLKQLAPMILFNSLVGLFYVITNIYIWDRLNGIFTYNSWSPIQVAIARVSVGPNGTIVPIGTFTPSPNYPFILFWISLAANFLFTVLALRSKEKNETANNKK